MQQRRLFASLLAILVPVLAGRAQSSDLGDRTMDLRGLVSDELSRPDIPDDAIANTPPGATTHGVARPLSLVYRYYSCLPWLLVHVRSAVSTLPGYAVEVDMANDNPEQVTVTLPGSVNRVAALTAMREWVRSAVPTPNEPVAGLPNAASASDLAMGRTLFLKAACANCHGGVNWTVSVKDFTSPPAGAEIFTERTGTFSGNEVIIGFDSLNGVSYGLEAWDTLTGATFVVATAPGSGQRLEIPVPIAGTSRSYRLVPGP